MHQRSGLKPAAGLLFGLGAGCTVILLGNSDSGARRRIALRASEARQEALVEALSKRLLSSHDHHTAAVQGHQPTHPHQQLESTKELPVVTKPLLTESSETHAISPSFYVVTGPDASLTSLAADRLSRTLLSGDDLLPPTRLTLPHDCVLGTGRFSRLLEQQLLLRPSRDLPEQAVEDSRGNPDRTVSPQTESITPPDHDDFNRFEFRGEPESGPAKHRYHSPSQHDQHSEDSSYGNENEAQEQWERSGEHRSPPPSNAAHNAVPSPATRREQPSRAGSRWESFVLAATRAVMDAEQLDQAALAALERVLSSTIKYDAGYRGDDTLRTETGSQSETDSYLELVSSEDSKDGRDTVRKPTKFVLEIVRSGPEDALPQGTASNDEDRGALSENEAGEEAGLCEELARWGWSLTKRGLAHVIVSSSNPWVLAEVQQALTRADHDGAVPGSTERYTGDAVGAVDHAMDVVGDSPAEGRGEVVVVRVALPTAAEREQVVISVAGELGVGHRLSVFDISMVAELTGGRDVGLLDVLRRIRDSPTVSEACEAVIADQARALATAWGLRVLSSDSHGGKTKGGADEAHREKNDRMGWAALWETLEVLSVPTVSIGAGAPSAPTPPQGSMPPAEILEEVQINPGTLLGLTKKGWLEISPMVPPGSGTVLSEPEFYGGDGSAASPYPDERHCHSHLRRHRPPVTVHSVIVPLESLARLERIFVGAPPLRLAAFRRLVDSAATPLVKNTEREVQKDRSLKTEGDAGEGLDGNWGSFGSIGEGGEQIGKGDGRPQGGRLTAATSERREELERAGCLIEASVRDRMCTREEAKLYEDGEMLSSNWAELGTVRSDLERGGPGDASEGEWAEVQLELIRQERAIVARACEMRARRGRLHNLRRNIQALESRAEMLSPSSPTSTQAFTQSPPPISRPRPRGLLDPESLAQRDDEHMGTLGLETTYSGLGKDARDRERQRNFTMDTAAKMLLEEMEEIVIRDAEKGVRLMPLKELAMKAENEQRVKGTSSGIGDSNTDYGIGGDVGGEGGRTKRNSAGHGRRLWRWLRGG